MKPRPLVLLIAAVTLALSGVLACSKKTTQPKVSSMETVPLNGGTWLVTVSFNATSGDTICAGLNGTTVDTVQVTTGLDDVLQDACDYQITGNTFTHACMDTASAYPGCVTGWSFTGSGTFTATSFSCTLAYHVADTPAGCNGGPTCAFTISFAGTRIGPPATPSILRPSAGTSTNWVRLRSQLLRR